MSVTQSKPIGYVTRFPWVVVLCSGVLCWCNLRAGDLSLTLRSHPELTLTNGIVGNNYSVQYSTNLPQPGSWQTLTNVALESSSNWSTTANFMKPPTGGILATLDPALIVTPPPGLEAGYVPIVIRQSN